MISIFYICRGLKLPALKKAVTATSSRMRSSKNKNEMGGKEGKQITVKEEIKEEIKPLIIHKSGLVDGTPEKLVVDVETLSFKPVLGGRLQTARRGVPFTPGNIHGWGRGRGRDGNRTQGAFINKEAVASTAKGDDEVIVEEGTTYNGWLATQGLIDLKSDQPKSGSIHKLHKNKGSKDNVEQIGDSSPKDDAIGHESSEVEIVELDKIGPVKEQDIVTSPIKSKEYVQRQAFVRRKLNIKKA